MPDGTTTRLRDIRAAFQSAVDHAVATKCKRMIILGDIFDSRTTLTLPVIDTVCRMFHAASKRLPLTIVAGNHDSYLRSPAINSLQAFRGFADIVDEGPVSYEDGVVAVPWHDDEAQVKAWVKASLPAKYLFTHALVKGAVMDKNKGIDPATLCPDQFKLVILGDVHEPVKIKPNLHYVGALLPLHFGDAGGNRGHAILDTTAGTLTRVENEISPRFHVVRQGFAGSIRKGDFVRVELSDPADAGKYVDKARKTGAWVESTAAKAEAVIAPRMDVRTSHSDEVLIKQYIDYTKATDPELFTMGMDIMAEARGA